MPFDFSNLPTPRATTHDPIVRNRTGQPKANPWLDKNMPYGLWESYNDDQAYGLDFPGKFEEVEYKKGEKKGELHTKVVGDAAEAILLVNYAAQKLGIGVTVRTKQSNKFGHIFVSWHGKERRKYTRNTETPAE